MKTIYFFIAIALLIWFSRSLDEGKDDSMACNAFANEFFDKKLDEALADPLVWRLAGYKNAHDYASAAKHLYLSKCIK